MAIRLRNAGIGCYNMKASYFFDLIYSDINLKKCSVEELEKIKGIGPKTARCFLLHSRPNQNYAGIDTHILKFLAAKGFEVPKSTPTGRRYRELEKEFVKLAKKAKKSVAEYDLEIWNEYSK
jgi:thermostable 8-oxoguanine DNA glycosylase